MRVICIDNENNPESPKLTIGKTYNVLGDKMYCGYLCYLIFCKNGDRHYYWEGYFIPLSSIDETEMIKEREMVAL